MDTASSRTKTSDRRRRRTDENHRYASENQRVSDPTRVFTLFADERVEKLREWEDWDAARTDLIGAARSTRLMRAYMLAYHAVPNVSLTMKQLENLRGDDVVMEDYLNNVMPLVVLNSERPVEIAGFGSEARVVDADFSSCGATVHKIDHVLLPFDGDDYLTPNRDNDDIRHERASTTLRSGRSSGRRRRATI